jgi:hypothetical protein
MIFFYVLVVGTVLFVCWAVGVHWIVWMFVALCLASVIFGFRKGIRQATAARLAANQAQPMKTRMGVLRKSKYEGPGMPVENFKDYDRRAQCTHTHRTRD